MYIYINALVLGLSDVTAVATVVTVAAVASANCSAIRWLQSCSFAAVVRVLLTSWSTLADFVDFYLSLSTLAAFVDFRCLCRL